MQEKIYLSMSEGLLGDNLLDFAQESNFIEGITTKAAHEVHAQALKEFILKKKIRIEDLEEFVRLVQPGAFLRRDPEHMVIIAGHKAPAPDVSVPQLEQLLRLINRNEMHPWTAHAEYESIHPFIDGNGRSGRALWLWQMLNHHNWVFKYSFLHMYYYQTLSKYRAYDGFKI